MNYKALMGSHVGHVDGFIIEIDTWTIRYLVVDLRALFLGKSMLIAAKGIERKI